jgi:hypothetical protein
MKPFRVLCLMLLCSTLFTACSSSGSRTTVQGYSDASLNRKRVFVLLPSASEITFTDAAQFGASRGVAAASAGETFDAELRTVLINSLQDRLDSNTIFNYADQAVAGLVPLSAVRDFTATGPVSWDNVRKARQEGAIDYLIVLRDVTVGNTAGSDARGNETVTTTYSLLDPSERKVMSSGTLSVDVSSPRTPPMTSERLAAALTSRLPFVVVE